MSLEYQVNKCLAYIELGKYNLELGKYICIVCNKSFKTEYGIYNHLERFHYTDIINKANELTNKEIT